MELRDYAKYDATSLADLVRKREVSAKELADCAVNAIAKVNPVINAVVEIYHDRSTELKSDDLADGILSGVPFLIKDVGGHEKGRLIEFGSRLAKGFRAERDSYYAKMIREAGINIIGRSNAPEFSTATSTENLLYGNTSNPWRKGFSAGGSTGGGMAAVASGVVPIAHGSDIGGSIRIPASWCGGVGLKPSRGRVSAGPSMAEDGFGLSMNFVQTKTMRDTALMMDILSVPQPGDPFVIPKPEESYVSFLNKPLKSLRIAMTTSPTMEGAEVDQEVVNAVKETGKLLAGLGHEIIEADLPFDQEQGSNDLLAIWFYGFHLKCDAIATKMGRKPGPDNLEPVIWDIYQKSKNMAVEDFMKALAALNEMRRTIGDFFADYDIVLCPSTALVSQPHGIYGLNHPGMDAADYMVLADKPVQYAFAFNATGAPAISLPLAMHSSGLPIGVQLAAKPAQEHLLIGLGALLEQALPWKDRLPPIHASH